MHAEQNDPWVMTLAERLRALYGADAPDSSGDLEHEWRREHQRLDAVCGAAGRGFLARYRVLHEIARGGMGRVVAAEDLVLGRGVALKTTDSGTDARRRLRLLREAEVVGRLHHPGVVPIHELGIDDRGEPYFAMPHLAGQTMATLLQERGRRGDAWPLPRWIEVLRRVCETMAHAHSRGVVHRDLKPANVMVGTFGEVWVMDWGLASTGGVTAERRDTTPHATPADPRLTAVHGAVGTPAYMPPEQAGAAAPDAAAKPSADTYGVGAILYEVLAGRPPYATERVEWTLEEILSVVRDRPPQPLRELASDAPPELIAVCERAMHRDPEQRYASIGMLADDLRAWAEHRTVAAHPSGPTTRVAKWLRRHRELSLGLAAAGALLAVAGLWFVLRLAEARDRAEASALVARAHLAEILDLAVVERVRDLRRRADTELWPATAEQLPALRSWLDQAESIDAARTALRARRGAVDATSPESVWRRRLLDDALIALDAFFAPEQSGLAIPLDSTVAAVRRRITAIESLEGRSRDAPEAQRAWVAARAAIRRSPHYDGLDLPPQSGLLPIGPDPASGLWEFAHLQTGTPAPRDRAGNLHFASDTGLVLVLLPGGRFTMGAAQHGPRNVDPLAEEINECPVHDVALQPFFLAKFEMTQGQWRTATGASPSVHGAVSNFVTAAHADLHPVESVSWHEVQRVLPRLGLSLPSEAQWEYGARAGTTTPWWAGRTEHDLLSPPAGNLADQGSAHALGTGAWARVAGLDDGFVMHAPVGTFRANAFGLHDVLGNVWEWCADEYVSYRTPPASGDGARPRSPSPQTVMYRGGAFDQPAAEARSANRAGAPPDRRHQTIGVRPARALQR
ncbi:MAG: SUMF1/EgtB/PvdO family nonheme iron enzyme [Planctomycetes bacterium]|nr:SUMF1/EgtB/PvdO family nonheme iron enzyme [Planctomycetota bacterium]MCB9869579.1 SUMF1/EgtB/PvdO family nonheme iron enzyme [Planctomycetota bacterium]